MYEPQAFLSVLFVAKGSNPIFRLFQSFFPPTDLKVADSLHDTIERTKKIAKTKKVLIFSICDASNACLTQKRETNETRIMTGKFNTTDTHLTFYFFNKSRNLCFVKSGTFLFQSLFFILF